MKELGITKGEWQAVWYAHYVCIQNGPNYSDKAVDNADEVGEDQAKANATLICDAGNTAQKCGLLPSELLQQRDELKEALNQINKLCSEGYEDTESIIDACLDLSFVAIKNREIDENA